MQHDTRLPGRGGQGGGHSGRRTLTSGRSQIPWRADRQHAALSFDHHVSRVCGGGCCQCRTRPAVLLDLSGMASPFMSGALHGRATHKEETGPPITAPPTAILPFKASSKLTLARCWHHCGNNSTGFIAVPEVASAAARLISVKSYRVISRSSGILPPCKDRRGEG